MTRSACFEQRLGRLARKLQVAAGLQEVHFLDHVQQQVGQLVGAVRAVGQQPAQVDVGEVGVGAAFLGRHAHLGRRRVVVELDEEGFQQLPGRLARQRAVGQPALVERQAGAGRGGRG